MENINRNISISRPLGVVRGVVISLLLLGILEERCLLPLLPSGRLTREVGRGFSVVVVVVIIDSRATRCRVDPAFFLAVVRLCLCWTDGQDAGEIPEKGGNVATTPPLWSYLGAATLSISAGP